MNKRVWLPITLAGAKAGDVLILTKPIGTGVLLAGGMRGAARGADVAGYTAHVKPTDVALYQYTSGTTGRSKGAELSHQAVLANAYQASLMTESLMGPEGETTLVILPLYHITAFALIFVAGMRTGSHGILIPSPRPPSNLKAAFEKHDVTWFTGINTLFAALLVEDWFTKDMVANVRFCGSGGAAQTTGVAQNGHSAACVAGSNSTCAAQFGQVRTRVSSSSVSGRVWATPASKSSSFNFAAPQGVPLMGSLCPQ